MREIDHVGVEYSSDRLEFSNVSSSDFQSSSGEPQVFTPRGTVGGEPRHEPPVRTGDEADVRVRAARAAVKDLVATPDAAPHQPEALRATKEHCASGEVHERHAPALSKEPGAGMAQALARNLTAHESADAAAIPPNMVGRIDEAAYAAAAARAERVFEGRMQSNKAPEADERMTARLADAVQAQREEEARIASAKKQRAALVAERNGSQESMAANGLGVMSQMPDLDPVSNAQAEQRDVSKGRRGTTLLSASSGVLTASGKILNKIGKSAKSSLVVAADIGAVGMSATKRVGAQAANVAVNSGAKGITAAAKGGSAAASAAGGTFRSVRSGGSSTGAVGGGDVPPPPPEPTKRRFGPWLTALGAIASLLFVGVISVWTYKLGQRDKFDVPVVAAMEGPARVRPEDAGGQQVDYQGLAVNEVLDGGGVEEIADVVVTAPRLRVLRSEDRAASELQALVVTPEPAAADENTSDIAVASEGTENAESNETEIAQAPVQEATVPESSIEIVTAPTPQQETPMLEAPASDANSQVAEITPLQAPEQSVTLDAPEIVDVAEQSPQTEATIPAEPLQVASLERDPALAPMSLSRPRLRPSDDVSAAMASAVDDALDAVIAEATRTPTVAQARQADEAGVSTTIPLPSGTRMIQLGAFDSASTAQNEWARFVRQHEDLLGTKERYIQKIERSGRTFYRLRVAGYQTRAETTAACAALSARGLPCITATVR